MDNDDFDELNEVKAGRRSELGRALHKEYEKNAQEYIHSTAKKKAAKALKVRQKDVDPEDPVFKSIRRKQEKDVRDTSARVSAANRKHPSWRHAPYVKKSAKNLGVSESILDRFDELLEAGILDEYVKDPMRIRAGRKAARKRRGRPTHRMSSTALRKSRLSRKKRMMRGAQS